MELILDHLEMITSFQQVRGEHMATEVQDYLMCPVGSIPPNATGWWKQNDPASEESS